MRLKKHGVFLSLALAVAAGGLQEQSALAMAEARNTNNMKEWTLLVFLNGHNNLDHFGKFNIKQMEEVGSTSQINVVVQWASMNQAETQRLYITKSTDPNQVTSPVVEKMNRVDMGDWKNLVDFVKWGVQHYPAKKYFVDVWDHGSGWHLLSRMGAMSRDSLGFNINDISWDDHTGHSISTAQLGQAMGEVSKFIGHKVDLYASDACLMAMPEVANEMVDSVEVFGGSEEVEPGAGWPYQAVLRRWAGKPTATAAEVGKILAEEYVSSYNGGTNGNSNATFSIFDLKQTDRLNQAVREFGSSLVKLDSSARSKVKQLASDTQRFTFDDYADLIDFMNLMDASHLGTELRGVSQRLRSSLGNYIVANYATPGMSRALGLSIWFPTSLGTYVNYEARYRLLKFHQATRWGDTIKALLQ